MGLESEGYIEYKVVKGVKDLEFQISKSKGSRMLDLLRAEETCWGDRHQLRYKILASFITPGYPQGAPLRN